MSIYKQQKATKPKPEDVAGDFLDIERTAAMLNFVEFLRANKIGIRWASGNAWGLHYKGRKFGTVRIGDGMSASYLHGSWYFSHGQPINRYYSMEDCDLKTFIFDNIYAKDCENCWLKHQSGLKKIGEMNPNACTCYPMRIFNPDEERMEYSKQLIKYIMNWILEESK